MSGLASDGGNITAPGRTSKKATRCHMRCSNLFVRLGGGRSATLQKNRRRPKISTRANLKMASSSHCARATEIGISDLNARRQSVLDQPLCQHRPAEGPAATVELVPGSRAGQSVDVGLKWNFVSVIACFQLLKSRPGDIVAYLLSRIFSQLLPFLIKVRSRDLVLKKLLGHILNGKQFLFASQLRP
jgi:hypothetical protein